MRVQVKYIARTRPPFKLRIYKNGFHNYPREGCTIFVFDATLDERELEALRLFITLPFPEPILRPARLPDLLTGADFLLPTALSDLGVGVGERDPPLEDAGVDKREAVCELGVTERSLRGIFLFLFFLEANISLASSSATVASAA